MPLPGGAAAPPACGRQRDHELSDELRRQVRHVCRGRIRRLRALLLRRPARRRDLPLALRHQSRGAEALRLNILPPRAARENDRETAAAMPRPILGGVAPRPLLQLRNDVITSGLTTARSVGTSVYTASLRWRRMKGVIAWN